MGSEHRIIVQLVRDDDARTLRDMITKHGASLLSARYEHKDNWLGWPSFGVSFAHLDLVVRLKAKYTVKEKSTAQ